MSKHVALFSNYNDYDSTKYNLLALFPDNEKPQLNDLSKILYSKGLEELDDDFILKVVALYRTLETGESVKIYHHSVDTNCKLSWIETGKALE